MICKILFRENWSFSPEILENMPNVEEKEGGKEKEREWENVEEKDRDRVKDRDRKKEKAGIKMKKEK